MAGGGLELLLALIPNSMWFRSKSSRGQEPSSPSKPLLEQKIVSGARTPQSTSRDPSPSKADPSPSKTNRGNLNQTPLSTPNRPDLPRAITTPIAAPHDYVLTEVPTRVSVSSSVGAGAGLIPRNNLPSNNLLVPGLANFQRGPSTANLAEDNSEGVDRLFDPFTGKPIATLNTNPNNNRSDTLPPINQGVVLETAGAESSNRQDAFSRNRGSIIEVEDPTRQSMWDYLAKIRSLQAEVAAMHLAMDGHGLGDPWGARPGGRSRAGSVNLKPGYGDNGSTTKISVTDLSKPPTSGSGMDTDSEDEGKGKWDAKDEEQFADLQQMFEKKQEALTGVMGKVGYQ